MRQMEVLIDATTTTKQTRTANGLTIDDCNGNRVYHRHLLRGTLFSLKSKKKKPALTGRLNTE